MERKINGIPLHSLFTEVPVGKVKTYDTAKAVFESFVGSNYDVAYNDLKIINIANISYVTIKVTITLVDDSGNRISRDYITSNEVGFKDGAPINLSITIDKAEKEAFRRCVCTNFLKVMDTAAKRDGSSATKVETGNTVANTQSVRRADNIQVRLVSELEELQGYNETYRCNGILDNNEVQIVFWYSTTKKIKTTGLWERLLQASKNHGTITITAKKERYKDKIQLSVNEVFF